MGHYHPYLPTKTGGRPRIHSLRDILNAIFYIVRSGCAWRLMRNDFAPWKDRVSLFPPMAPGWYLGDHAYRTSRTAPAEAWTERAAKCRSVDSQSVKTTAVGGTCGYNGGKKINGRKRHFLVDTQGLLLKAKVHSAGIMDRDGIKLLLDGLGGHFPTLRHLWADSGYNGKGKGKDWLKRCWAGSWSWCGILAKSRMFGRYLVRS